MVSVQSEVSFVCDRCFGLFFSVCGVWGSEARLKGERKFVGCVPLSSMRPSIMLP